MLAEMGFNFYDLIGNELEFSLEHRLLNIILIFGFCLAIWSAVTNYILDLDSLLVLSCIIYAVVLAALYYTSVVKHRYQTVVWILVIVVFIIIPASWILNGGISGSIPFYVILFSSMGATMLFGIRRIAVIAGFLVAVNALLFLEYYYPSIIVAYAGRFDRFIDISIGLMTTIIFNVWVFMVILKHYKAEQDKAQRYLAQSEQAQEHLLYLIYHDSLTGLYNRTYFEKEITEFSGSTAEGVGVFMIDIDGLKFVNDTFGHAQGDVLLTQAATIFQLSFRPQDVIARTGGDEFSILVRGSSLEDMETLYKRIRDNNRLENEKLSESAISVQMSIGFAYSTERDLIISDLLREADNKMYREKLYRKAGIQGSIIQTLKQMLVARDYNNEAHSDRMQTLIADFALAAGIPESEITGIQLFAEFHDVGKIGIPDHILNKQGTLNDEERLEIQRHCEIGYRIAQASTDLLPISDWILKHHEWWNGAGYPLGLVGEQIPFECRVMAVVDAYDAMTSPRPYREAMSHQAAITELKCSAGSQFDPQLVKIFCSQFPGKSSGEVRKLDEAGGV